MRNRMRESYTTVEFTKNQYPETLAQFRKLALDIVLHIQEKLPILIEHAKGQRTLTLLRERSDLEFALHVQAPGRKYRRHRLAVKLNYDPE